MPWQSRVRPAQLTIYSLRLCVRAAANCCASAQVSIGCVNVLFARLAPRSKSPHPLVCAKAALFDVDWRRLASVFERNVLKVTGVWPVPFRLIPGSPMSLQATSEPCGSDLQRFWVSCDACCWLVVYVLLLCKATAGVRVL